MNLLFRSLSATVKRTCQSIALQSIGVCGTAVIVATPALSAERVYVTYGPLEASVPVKSLELFAKTGEVDTDWDGFAQYLNQEQLAQLRIALQARADISPITISQFLYTPQGEVLLERLGRVIQTKARQPGFYAIRAALILSASQSEGLTIINLLRNFPTYGIRINLGRALEVVNQLTGLINQSNRSIAGVIELSDRQASADSTVNRFNLPDPQKPGPYSWEKYALTLNSPRRNRTFPLDLYLPKGSPQPAPVVVISHGLGSDLFSFAYLGEHLASYGFAVAIPEHPGSNAQQLQDLITGRANEVAESAEFINRPLDVKEILDFLEALSQSEATYRGQLDLQRVGVIGQSFGGYTALALAGATINFQQLDRDCQLERETWNLSLLLQCQARTLPRGGYDLNDNRVKAAIAINPIASSLLGEASLSQVKIPLMIVGGSADTVAPALLEQIQPFTWLTTPNKYLVLMRNGTHFSVINSSPQSVFKAPPEIIGPEPALARRYLSGLSLAFLKIYLSNQPNYGAFLQPSYLKSIGREGLSLSILRSLTAQQLQQLFTRTPAASPTDVPSLPPQPVPSISPSELR